jgi:hypothetical protein
MHAPRAGPGGFTRHRQLRESRDFIGPSRTKVDYSEVISKKQLQLAICRWPLDDAA